MIIDTSLRIEKDRKKRLKRIRRAKNKALRERLGRGRVFTEEARSKARNEIERKIAENLKRFTGRSNDFYRTEEWLRLRYLVLKRYQATCMCCGERGSREKPVHVDHIKPRSKYPELGFEISNLQVLCQDCNLGKSNIDDTGWRPKTPSK